MRKFRFYQDVPHWTLGPLWRNILLMKRNFVTLKWKLKGLWNFDFQSRILPWEVKRVKWQFCDYSIKGNNIFTDGLKIDQKVGAAFVYFLDSVEIENIQFRLKNGASVFMAEVMAIRETIAYSHEKNLKEVRIISDSRSDLMALNSLDEGRQIKNVIKESMNNNIELCWVRYTRKIQCTVAAKKSKQRNTWLLNVNYGIK
ncbi:hypothetical protein AVEN_87847-1 [Araneus ventricosus]|uniref:RNase H type-1 domain-containing protein n=1 Tax=Araneus ventricosus TaxID=182803 RepID=A0A4Y2BBE3_ARAVE|nr:hypothetical protein AVEN_87847-1 [Araneus ventricosus]